MFHAFHDLVRMPHGPHNFDPNGLKLCLVHMSHVQVLALGFTIPVHDEMTDKMLSSFMSPCVFSAIFFPHADVSVTL